MDLVLIMIGMCIERGELDKIVENSLEEVKE